LPLPLGIRKSPLLVVSIHGGGHALVDDAGDGLGNTASNGIFRAASVTTDTFALVDPVTGANVAGNGAYTSGGRVWKLSGVDFMNDIAAGAKICPGTPATLSSKAVSAEGYFSAANTTLGSLTGDQAEGIILIEWNTSDADSRPFIIMTGASSGMPVTPNGGDINITWPTYIWKQ